MRRAAFTLALLVALPLAGALPPAAPALTPQQLDPDVPPATAPIASFQVFLNERYSFTEEVRTRTLRVPDAEFDRVILTFHSRPAGDPWDRLVGVGIAGVEVLKATTPRAQFNLTKDITEYASLLPAGEDVPVSLYMGTWVGALLGSVRIDFYADEPTAALVPPAAESVIGAQRWAYVGGTGSVSHATAHFPAAAPTAATLEVRTSGHGADGEFWFLNPVDAHPIFHILVDGVEIGLLVPAPYTYALVGFGTGSVVADTVVNPGMWWGEQRVADAAGVHTGVGEIPAYRAQIDEAHLPLLTGEREVTFAVESGGGVWITSIDFLLEV